MNKYIFIVLLSLCFFNANAQYTITTKSEIIKSDFKKVKNGYLIILKKEASSQTSIPINEIESIHKDGNDFTHNSYINANGKKFECDIIGTDARNLYYVSINYKVLSINLDSVSDFVANSKDTTLLFAKPLGNEFNYISKSGEDLKTSVTLRIIGMALGSLTPLYINKEPIMVGVFGSLGIIFYVGSIIKEYQAAENLQRAAKAHVN